MRNFALIGAGGYIAPRHLAAVRDTGNRLVAAVDPKDSVGVLDQYSFDVRFFTEIERFDRHLEKLRRGPEADRVHFVSICTPNYLHDAHCRLALRLGADVICEKPLVINPWNLDQLEAVEQETKRRVFTVMQLRVHPELVALKQRLATSAKQSEVVLTYVTSRGRWYDVSWKGQLEKSGGIPTNIGIHLFDLLLWLFGPCASAEVHVNEPRRMGGALRLQHAEVRWFLSIREEDVPEATRAKGRTTFRSITIDGEAFEFSDGFNNLHTRVYEDILGGKGLGIADARPAIELTNSLRRAPVSTSLSRHPMSSV